jgi:predicted transcriptional regulator
MHSLPEFRRNILVSIRPNYADKIIAGHKTVELRRRFPADVTGAAALIYSSSPIRAVIATVRIKQVLKLPVARIWKQHGPAACISKRAFDAYFRDLKLGFAILFDELRPLANQLSADELIAQFGIVPPQSYRYVTGECVALVNDERLQAAHRHKRRHRAGGSPASRSIAG